MQKVKMFRICPYCQLFMNCSVRDEAKDHSKLGENNEGLARLISTEGLCTMLIRQAAEVVQKIPLSYNYYSRIL